MITFDVIGIPKGQPRARRSKYGGVYTPEAAKSWKDCVAIAGMPVAREMRPIEGPVQITVVYRFPRSKWLIRLNGEHPGQAPHMVKPDIDNINKATLDCLTNMGILRDDCQIFHIDAHKFYAARDEQPGATITITEWRSE